MISRDNLYLYVRRKLGFPTVAVELTDDQINECIQDVLDLFNHYVFTPVASVALRQQDDVVIDLGSDCLGILRCEALMPYDESYYLQMNIFELMYRMVFHKLPVGEWYLLRSFYETYQKVRGTDPDWYYDEATHKLFVDCHSGPYDVAYIAAMKVDLDTMLAEYEDLFKKGVLAGCKRILARVRGKFGGVNAPGGMLTTDSDKLDSAGEKEWGEVVTELKATQPPAPVVVG